MRIDKTKIFWLIVIITLFSIDPIFAGPGGYIAKGLFKTFWGKLLLFAIVIILLPLIFYIKIVEFLKVRKNKKILQNIMLHNIFLLCIILS